jgi:MFS family permease
LKLTALRKARIAVFAYFTLAGATVTFWAVHIPFIENKLDISHATIGSLLLVFGAGALTAIQLIGNVIDRIGSNTATSFSAIFMGALLFTPGLADSTLLLGVALFFLGLGVGSTDVGMNAHAVEVEKAYKRPIFSAFHAMWSLGGLLGAGLGGLALASGFDMQTTLSLAASGIILIALYMKSWMLPDNPNLKVAEGDNSSNQENIKAANQANRKVLGYVLFLGAMAAAAAIAEGTGIDWSALHHVKIIGSTEAFASIALVVYTGAMGFTRLVIDKVVEAKGRIFVIRFGALISAVGTSLVVISDTSLVALLGWIIAGIGIAGVVPQIFAYSAEVGEESHTGRNMAKVVGITYAGVLAGPAIIGFLAEFVPLNIAIGLGILLGIFTSAGTLLIERRTKNGKAV